MIHRTWIDEQPSGMVSEKQQYTYTAWLLAAVRSGLQANQGRCATVNQEVNAVADNMEACIQAPTAAKRISAAYEG
ncbi:MAG: hypothetical protein ACYDCF_09175 [Burkholderiales bacterium]